MYHECTVVFACFSVVPNPDENFAVLHWNEEKKKTYEGHSDFLVAASLLM